MWPASSSSIGVPGWVMALCSYSLYERTFSLGFCAGASRPPPPTPLAGVALGIKASAVTMRVIARIGVVMGRDLAMYGCYVHSLSGFGIFSVDCVLLGAEATKA